jgi:hypothetical protein
MCRSISLLITWYLAKSLEEVVPGYTLEEMVPGHSPE